MPPEELDLLLQGGHPVAGFGCSNHDERISRRTAGINNEPERIRTTTSPTMSAIDA